MIGLLLLLQRMVQSTGIVFTKGSRSLFIQLSHAQFNTHIQLLSKQVHISKHFQDKQQLTIFDEYRIPNTSQTPQISYLLHLQRSTERASTPAHVRDFPCFPFCRASTPIPHNSPDHHRPHRPRPFLTEADTDDACGGLPLDSNKGGSGVKIQTLHVKRHGVISDAHFTNDLHLVRWVVSGLRFNENPTWQVVVSGLS